MNNRGDSKVEAIAKTNSIILLVGMLMVAGVMAAKFSNRVGVPALVLFVGLGMLLGRFFILTTPLSRNWPVLLP